MNKSNVFFPVKEYFKFKRNPSASRNKSNKYKQDLKNMYLNENFRFCPKCKKQDLLEIMKNNKLVDFCLSCRFSKIKEEK